MTCSLKIKSGNIGNNSLETNQIKVLRKIVGKIKKDRIRSQQIRESCAIKPINEWVEIITGEWVKYLRRMDQLKSRGTKR